MFEVLLKASNVKLRVKKEFLVQECRIIDQDNA